MKRVLRAALIVALAAALGLLARTHLVSTVRIKGTSMESTLQSGDVALVWKPMGDPTRGDVVCCVFPQRGGTYVKRLVGLPGDALECTGGALVRNGRPVSEPYVSSIAEDFAVVLNDDEYYALGDNRAESYDSRSADMGALQKDDLLGKVVWILWPPSRFGPVA